MKPAHIDDTYRLYIREWVVTHTLFSKSYEVARLYDEGNAWIKENLSDIPAKDIQLRMYSDDAGTFWCHVEVFKENQKGEFKQLGAAETYAQIHSYDEYTIVPRNCTADLDIRNYGAVKP